MLTGISWQEAQSRLLAWVQPLGTDQVRLRHAMSHFVDSPILGGAPYPAYNLATERGYALNYDALLNCWQRGESAKFIHGGHLGGARSFERRVEASHAYSVDAGTLLPDALDLVVTEAEAVRDGSEVVVRSRPPRHQNVFARGRFVPPGEVLLPEGHRIGYPAYTTLYSQPQLKEVRVLRKSTVGSLIIGAGLHDAQEENPPEGACRELLSPLLTGLSARWQFPFISLGVQPAHRSLADTVNAACDQIDLLVCTGLLSSSHLAELEAVIRDHCELRVRGRVADELTRGGVPAALHWV